MVTVSAGSRDVKADAADYESPASNSPVNTDMDVVPRDNGEEHLPGVVCTEVDVCVFLLLLLLLLLLLFSFFREKVLFLVYCT